MSPKGRGHDVQPARRGRTPRRAAPEHKRGLRSTGAARRYRRARHTIYTNENSVSLPIFHMVSGAPEPVAPYSHAVEIDGWLFVTGQLATDVHNDPADMPEGIEAQTDKVMQNLRTVLQGVGVGFENVVCVRVFLTHFEEDYSKMNRIYASYFSEDKRPARTCVGVTALAGGGRVEIDLIARRP